VTPTDRPIVHRKLLAWQRFDGAGITMRCWPGGEVAVHWEDVEFVSPTPAWEQGPDGWRPKENRYASLVPSLIATYRMMSLAVVVRDWHKVAHEARGWTGLWLSRQFRPLSDADDRPEPLRGFFEITVRLPKLSAPPAGLVALIAQHTRLDLLVLDG